MASRRLALGSLVRAKTKPEAERVGKYMLRPILALERLTFLESEGKVGYRYGEKGAEQETMDYLEFIARVTSHIPDKGQVMVRYFGLYANAHRGKVKKASQSPTALRIVEEELRRLPSKGWAALIRKPHIGLRSAAMIRKVYEVDPMTCPKCGGRMKVVAFLTEVAVVDRIIDHLKLTFVAAKPQPCSPHGFHEGRRPMLLPRSSCRWPTRAGHIVEYLMIRGERESIVFLPRRRGFLPLSDLRARFSRLLTSPGGRKYIADGVKLGDSSVGAGIRGVTEKGNTYPLTPDTLSPRDRQPGNQKLAPKNC